LNLKVKFPGEARVDAEFGPFHIITNQDGTAPSPFSLFLASIGTCAGIYVKGFCDQRGIATAGMEIEQQMTTDPVTQRITNITLEIRLPNDFPEKYRDAVIRAADQCTVKKYLANPPSIMIKTV
jgi:putative redox protein